MERHPFHTEFGEIIMSILNKTKGDRINELTDNYKPATLPTPGRGLERNLPHMEHLSSFSGALLSRIAFAVSGSIEHSHCFSQSNVRLACL